MIKKAAIIAIISTSILIPIMSTGSAEKSYGKNIIWQIKPKTLEALRLHTGEYSFDGNFHEGMARLKTFSEEDINVYDERGRTVFIDTEAKILKTVKIYNAEDFHDGMAAVQLNQDGKWGFINKDGELIIKPQFFEVNEFSEGLAYVQLEQDGKWGFINKDGNFVIKPKFKKHYSSFRNGQAVVDNQGLFGAKYIIINKEGETVGEIKKDKIFEGYDYYTDFYDNIAGVQKDKKWGFINKEGKIIIEPQYYAIGRFNKGSCFVYDGKCKYIDEQNKTLWIYPSEWYPDHDHIKWLHDGIYKKWIPIVSYGIPSLRGFINIETGFIIRPQFQEIDTYLFCEGLVAVKDNFKWGYIDESGSIVIDTQFNWCHEFHEGLALVRTDEGCGYIKNPLTAKK